jgi:hypothetical protein
MFLKAYCWVGIGLYIVLSIADLTLTSALLRMNGAAYESNPAAAACLEHFGWPGLALYKLGGVSILVGAVYLLSRRRASVGAAVVTFACAVLLVVTTYTHSLILESQSEIAERGAVWQRYAARTNPHAEGGFPRLDRCWFTAK